MSATLFERCGGFSCVRGIVTGFYRRMLDSPRLGRYFASLNMRRLIEHQTKFITYVMGGPATYADAQLARSHQGLGISAAEFAEMLELLRATLEEAGLEGADLDQVLNGVRQRERLIVAQR